MRQAARQPFAPIAGCSHRGLVFLFEKFKKAREANFQTAVLLESGEHRLFADVAFEQPAAAGRVTGAADDEMPNFARHAAPAAKQSPFADHAAARAALDDNEDNRTDIARIRAVGLGDGEGVGVVLEDDRGIAADCLTYELRERDIAPMKQQTETRHSRFDQRRRRYAYPSDLLRLRTRTDDRARQFGDLLGALFSRQSIHGKIDLLFSHQSAGQIDRHRRYLIHFYAGAEEQRAFRISWTSMPGRPV